MKNDISKENNNSSSERNRLLQVYRIKLGVGQMIIKPILNLWLIPVISTFLLLWVSRSRLVNYLNLSKFLKQIYEYTLIAISIIVPLIFLLAVVEGIASWTAKKPERAIRNAFDRNERRNGDPILILKKKIKNSNVIRYVFYSGIPLKIWNENKDAIASNMNIHFVEEMKYYKGKGELVELCVAKGIEQSKRHDLYDDEM